MESLDHQASLQSYQQVFSSSTGPRPYFIDLPEVLFVVIATINYAFEGLQARLYG